MKCPNCHSENILEYYIDEYCRVFTEEQVNDLTFHEKEIAAQCDCEDCGYSNQPEAFISDNDSPSIFDSVSDFTRPMELNLSMKRYY